MTLETVRLRNGSEEAKVLVATTMMSLTSLWERGLPGVLAVYDLREIIAGRGNRVNKDTVKMLQDLALVGPDGRVHESIKNVVLSAVQGEGLNTFLGSPFAKQEASPSADTRAVTKPDAEQAAPVVPANESTPPAKGWKATASRVVSLFTGSPRPKTVRAAPRTDKRNER